MTRRNNFSARTKRLVRERSGGVCEVHRIPEESRKVRYPTLPLTCKRKARDVDHVNPDWAGGGNQPEDAAHLCVVCHKIKTYTDNREAKKSARLRGDTGNGAKKKIQSRGFDKAFRKKMDGSVERRRK